jgi:hypothetical protein
MIAEALPLAEAPLSRATGSELVPLTFVSQAWVDNVAIGKSNKKVHVYGFEAEYFVFFVVPQGLNSRYAVLNLTTSTWYDFPGKIIPVWRSVKSKNAHDPQGELHVHLGESVPQSDA